MARNVRKAGGYKTFKVTFQSGQVLTLVDTSADIEDQASFYKASYGRVVKTQVVREGV